MSQLGDEPMTVGIRVLLLPPIILSLGHDEYPFHFLVLSILWVSKNARTSTTRFRILCSIHDGENELG